MHTLKPLLIPLTLNRALGAGLVLREELVALQCGNPQTRSIGTMSERREIPSLDSEETSNSSRGNGPFSTELDEHTGTSHGKTTNFTFQTGYRSPLTPTSEKIRRLRKGTTSSFAHLTHEIGSPGVLGGEHRKDKKKRGKKGRGEGSLSSDQRVQPAGGESSGLTGSATAPRVENFRVQPSTIPLFSDSAASRELRQESYDNHWYGNIPVSDPAIRAPRWSRGDSHRPCSGDPVYPQEGSLDWRQSGTTYSNGPWGYRSEESSSWDHGIHRLQLPSQQQPFPNPQSAFFNPPSPWQQQQPRGHHNNRSQYARSSWDRRPHDRGSSLPGDGTPLPAPAPTQDYLAKSLLKPQTLPRAPKQLLVLDLNGTLVYRRKGNTANPKCRPELDSFLDYIFTHFSVMVWTSAQPGNAHRMVNTIFTEEQKKKLLTVWARDTLQLTPNQYREKTTVYKRLTRIWAGEFKLHFPSPDQSDPGWDQTNTILIDDSSVKAAGQPYNLIRVPEFVGDTDDGGSPVLPDCIKYLNELRFQDNVSAYIRQSPFYGRY
ncbi:HAD-like domain-containing protein [Tuber brumale]|nr:HAD-like domain-containing protein [Tuber brumale]